jgi:hypothetical protein
VKHIVYKYDDDQRDEIDFDAQGLLTFTKGDLVLRHGANWKIDDVQKEENLGLARIPTYWIYLSRIVVN